MMPTATALAHPNIAFIKYWGNRDDDLRLPANGSISMNLAGLETVTTVAFSPRRTEDEFVFEGVLQSGPVPARPARTRSAQPVHTGRVCRVVRRGCGRRILCRINRPDGSLGAGGCD